MNSIPDVLVDEIHDLLRVYFVGLSITMVSDLCLSILHHFVFNF